MFRFDPTPGPARPLPATDVEVVSLRLSPQDGVPNNPDLPVLIYPGCLSRQTAPDRVRALFVLNDWAGTWTYTVFDYHHYHPNAHEALAVASGTAQIQIGGPNGQVLSVATGDVLILPAGTGHCRISASNDFTVCGAYPPGQENYETLDAARTDPGGMADRIARVSLPLTDPIYGPTGPLMAHWAEDQHRG